MNIIEFRDCKSCCHFQCLLLLRSKPSLIMGMPKRVISTPLCFFPIFSESPGEQYRQKVRKLGNLIEASVMLQLTMVGSLIGVNIGVSVKEAFEANSHGRFHGF